MSNAEPLRQSPFPAYSTGGWSCAILLGSLWAASARAVDLPDPYSTFGLPPGGPAPERSYRSFGTLPGESERSLAMRGRLPELDETTFWQRLADYKARGGVRVLTLLDFDHSTLALQAGHGASPSLQWTSHRFRGGHATRGLLDRLVSAVTRPLAAPLHKREPEIVPRRPVGP
jgi:hypothetical protein